MRIILDLTEPEYLRFKRKYPVLKDEDGYYFETQNPYLEYGLKVGLPEELKEYAIDEDSE
jgi:transketolase C-terminal domain/subunit